MYSKSHNLWASVVPTFSSVGIVCEAPTESEVTDVENTLRRLRQILVSDKEKLTFKIVRSSIRKIEVRKAPDF